MPHASRALPTLILAVLAVSARAQSGPDLLPVVFEAESGAIGGQFAVLDDAA